MNNKKTRMHVGIGVWLLVAVPVLIGVFLEGRQILPWLHAIILGLLVSSASLIVGVFISYFAGDRDFGLGNGWNSNPFSLLLRHSDRHMNPIIKDHMHARLSILFSNGSTSSREWEICDAAAADALYNEWTTRLFYAVQDRHRFTDLYFHRASYKRRLQLLAAAPTGIIFSVLYGLVGLASLIVLSGTRNFNGITTYFVIMCSILWTGFWANYMSYSLAYSAGVMYLDEVVLAVDMLFHDHWEQQNRLTGSIKTNAISASFSTLPA